MKILYLVEKYPPVLGGDGIHVSNLRKNVKYPSRVLTKSEYGAHDEPDVTRVGLKTNILSGRVSFFLESFFRCLELDYDLLHVHGGLCALVGAKIKKIRNEPIVYTIHGIWDKVLEETHGSLAPVFRVLERRALRGKYDAVISVDSWAEHIARNMSENKVYRIPNGIDIKKFKPGNERDDFVLAVGRLIKHKGFEYLADAVPGNIQVKIIGSGPRTIQGKNVQLLRSLEQDKLISYYQRCKIFVLPSLWEGFPFTLLEAMSCGCACIATDVGGVRDLIDDRKNGLLTRPRDSEDLKNKIQFLLDNERERKRLGKAARKKVEKNFTWKKVARDTEKVYESVL